MKRILIPVDFSPAMEPVLALGREIARAFEAEVHLVHVREIAAVPVFPAATIGYPGMGLPEMGMAGAVPMAREELVSADSPNDSSWKTCERETSALFT